MDTPPNTHPIGIDHAETWAETTPVPAIERRRTTPDPDGVYTPPSLRRPSAAPDIEGDLPTPILAPAETPPSSDGQPQQGSAASLVPIATALATPGPDGQAPLGKLVAALGGPVVLLAILVFYLHTKGQEQTSATISDAMTRAAAEHKLERERDKIEDERRAVLQETAHTKLHDQERRELDARLDKLLQVVERQEVKIDDLTVRVGELQPKRR